MKEKKTVKISVEIPEDLALFLDEMVRKGEARNISEAVRNCIALAKAKKLKGVVVFY